MTFHSSPLIFICPDPMHTRSYLSDFSITAYVLKKNTASKFLKFTYHLIIRCGSVAHNILVFSPDRKDDINVPQFKSMCLNFNFCLYHSSVIDFKSRISSYARINSMISQVMNVNLRFLYGHMHGTIVFFDFCQILI